MKYIVVNIFFLFVTYSYSYSQGSLYCGPYKKSAPIVFNNINDTVINLLEISNSKGHCIELNYCSNVIIKNCKLGPAKGQGINLYNCKNITVLNCSIDSIATGVYAGASTGIKVLYNDMKNVIGPMPRGQMVQFAEVFGENNYIKYNALENIPGQSFPEDAISLFKSKGTVNNPIKVIGNWIRGGGPSTSGGGIMTGDQGGSYILVQDNILVDPGQYGITIASGHHISIKNNKIYARQQSFNSVGISAYKQYPIECFADTILNNQVNYRFKDGSLNNLLNSGDFGVIYGWSTNYYNPNLSPNMLPNKIIGRCEQKNHIHQIK